MKHYKLTLFIAFLLSALCAQAVVFRFDAHSVVPSSVKAKMEANVSSLLTELQRAGAKGDTVLNLSSIDMEPGAKTRLQSLWDDLRFVCDEDTYVTKCLNDFQGFQVRNIFITMKPADASYQGDINRELTISLNKRGEITGVRLALEINQDIQQMLQVTGTSGVTELAQRRELLKWVEDFRCYYNERNLNALEQIYGDDALILTGSVVKQRKIVDDNTTVDYQVIYTVQDKKAYIEKLRNIFKSKTYLNVEFDHISVMKHGTKPNTFGVTLHQKWTTNTYHDEGWLFLLWDFRNPGEPIIHVRTWQPDEIIAKGEDLFDVYSFDL